MLVFQIKNQVRWMLVTRLLLDFILIIVVSYLAGLICSFTVQIITICGSPRRCFSSCPWVVGHMTTTAWELQAGFIDIMYLFDITHLQLLQ